jgi:hypothetical protein
MATNRPILERIQRLQFTDRPQAEVLAAEFIGDVFSQLEIAQVRLRPQAISLNSFNGFLTLTNGQELFFKTHVEQDGVIQEYYNAAMLAEAGYPVIQPLYTSEQADQQILIYEVVKDPSVFDAARALETDRFADDRFQALTQAQNASDKQLMTLYEQTLDDAPREAVANAPIHQLFYHRLTGGRLDRFYGEGITIQLPHQPLSLHEVRQKHWVINGTAYTETLDTLIARASEVLNPTRLPVQTIIGHGDAHNGNVFFDEPQRTLTYFDPAFAGRHHPLLDLVKPLYHNVFAMWMYFPEDEAEKLTITLREQQATWIVAHNYEPNPIRQMFLESKVSNTLIPLLKLLQGRDLLPLNWRDILKLGLFCCPFLTLDLKRFPPTISLLGLTMAVQMGAESSGVRSLIDQTLDRVAIQTDS